MLKIHLPFFEKFTRLDDFTHFDCKNSDRLHIWSEDICSVPCNTNARSVNTCFVHKVLFCISHILCALLTLLVQNMTGHKCKLVCDQSLGCGAHVRIIAPPHVRCVWKCVRKGFGNVSAICVRACSSFLSVRCVISILHSFFN